MASGDGPRPIMTCPVSGIDEGEFYDAAKLVKQVETYFDVNEDRFCNFQENIKLVFLDVNAIVQHMKFKMLHLLDLKWKGEVLFDLTIGGGLSKSKQIATRANRYVKTRTSSRCSSCLCRNFRDNGNRDNRNKAE